LRNAATAEAPETQSRKDKKQGLTFKEKKEFEILSTEIEFLESEKKAIENDLSHSVLANEELLSKSKRHGEIVKTLDEKELRWLELSEK
jgi:ATP-binding cassette subfamily F protein uup